MIDKSLGTKRLCPACHVKFYDLNRSPAKCPKCGEEFVPKPILPSKQDQMEAAQAEAGKVAELEAPEVADVVEAAEVEEAAAEIPEDVAEVALEDAEDVAVEPDDSAVFLEDDDPAMEKIIPTAPVDPEEEES